MDPTQNPSATPNPTPGAAPSLTPEMPGVVTNPATSATPSLASPAMNEAPSPSPSEVAGAATNLEANPATTAAANPLTSATPSPAPSVPASSETPVSPVSSAVNPVGGLDAVSAPSDGALGASGTPGVAAPVNPIIQPGGATTGLANMDGLLSTDPIMKPEPLPAPDPVEEELKTPMKAAGLAPGSIGSASGVVDSEGKAETPPVTNGPSSNNPFSNLFKKKQTPSVAFNDPAKANETNEPGKPELSVPGVKPKNPNLKINKQTMIILIALAAVLVVVLIIILITQLNSGPSSSASNNTNNNSSVNTQTTEPESTPEVSTNLSCTRKMTAEELTGYKDSVDGMVLVSATFDNKDNLISLSNTWLVEYTDKKTAEPIIATESLVRTTPDGIDATNVEKFMLKVANDGGVDTDLKSIVSNYQDLDFTCETL